LYNDGNISIPTIHDFLLFSALEENKLDGESQTKLNTILEWIFNEKYRHIPTRYGYFYIPGGSYTTKAVCLKLDLPELSGIRENRFDFQILLHRVDILSHFSKCRKTEWFQDAISLLDSYKNTEGRYAFPKDMLLEKKDGYWIFGSHMGLGENRRIRISREIESTYWMERIIGNMSNGKI
jgi:hypothetical protein